MIDIDSIVLLLSVVVYWFILPIGAITLLTWGVYTLLRNNYPNLPTKYRIFYIIVSITLAIAVVASVLRLLKF